MSKSSKDLGNNRFRESFGRYFEEFEVGHVYEHRPGRTITESDNTWFTLLTMNTHPLHFDKEYGKATEFGKNLVNSTFTVSVMVGGIKFGLLLISMFLIEINFELGSYPAFNIASVKDVIQVSDAGDNVKTVYPLPLLLSTYPS